LSQKAHKNNFVKSSLIFKTFSLLEREGNFEREKYIKNPTTPYVATLSWES